MFDAIFKPRECRLKVRYIEYVPGQPLEFDDEPEMSLT